MTTQPRSDRHLPEILDSLYLGSAPAYRDDVLASATRSRQRPAWTFPGRWFPMVEIARQPASFGRLPWRTLATAILVLVLIAAAAAIYVGSRQQRVPAPFGPARNGLIAYTSSVDRAVYTADPVTGETHKVVTIPTEYTLIDALFTWDGTRMIFETRAAGADTGRGVLWSVKPDGSGLIQLTPNPLQDIWAYELSPDGRSILMGSTVAGTKSISLANLDGSGVRTLDLGGVPVGSAAFRPPDGKEILFTGDMDSAHNGEMYLVNADGTDLRPLVKTPRPLNSDAVWSPDGTHFVYAWQDEPLHIMAADGTGDRVLREDPSQWEGWAQWSPDGTRLVIQRAGVDRVVTSIVRADGTGSPIDITGMEIGARYQWSPDSSTILALPIADVQQHQQLWDATTGLAKVAPWGAVSYPTWQRLAP